MLKITKRDYLFCICTLLLAGCICAFVYGFLLHTAGDTVEIFRENERISVLSLHDDQTFVLAYDSANMTLEIRDGCVNVTSSACPGQDCVHTPPISKAGQVILCAKQNVLIRISCTDAPDGVVS